MNIFGDVKRGELRGIIQIALEDETRLRRDLESYYGKRIKGRLYDWLKEHKDYDVFMFTTTMGDYDPDYLNWYGVIEKDADVLVIVNRSVGSNPT